ncbi:MAG: twin-arginine translocase subunit TatC [Zavarzinella sp.]
MLSRRDRARPVYDENFFESTRMSFGDHLEELRVRMWRALVGLFFFLVIGFILDGLGDYFKIPQLGIGKPMLKVITAPVEDKVREFFAKRNEIAREKLANAREKHDINRLTETKPMQVQVPTKAFTDTFEGLKLKDPDQEYIDVTLKVSPPEINTIADEGGSVLEKQQFLTSLSVTEAFMVYIKVSLLCGVVLASPWLFWQAWAFIGAGLYPHEKRLVHVYMPFSIFLFLAGVFLCQFIVIPRAVAALLVFNQWIGIDPDFRLKEWLGFAIVMPLVFGLSFQTPLVMTFFNRIGMFTWRDYLSKWRHAVMLLAIMAALLTPSPDIVSMMWLFVPTFSLYLLGILICYYSPPLAFEEDEEEELIGF